MKYLILSLLIGLLYVATSCGSESADPCHKYGQALEGRFATKLMQGTWRFKGGQAGTINIRGLDYNDMDCGYQIMNCITGEAHINCEGAGVDKDIVVISKDSIEVGRMLYVRVDDN